MLEQGIVKLYRRIFAARRENLARRYDNIARNQGSMVRFYESVSRAYELLDAPAHQRAAVLVDLERHRAAKRAAERRAADIRAGRR